MDSLASAGNGETLSSPARALQAYQARAFVSLVIARVKVQQVAAFIDVDEWYPVRLAVYIYSAYVRDFLSAEELSGFRSLPQPRITLHAPAQVKCRSRH